MEATSDYWQPFYYVLEDGPFEMMLVSARHVKLIFWEVVFQIFSLSTPPAASSLLKSSATLIAIILLIASNTQDGRDSLISMRSPVPMMQG